MKAVFLVLLAVGTAAVGQRDDVLEDDPRIQVVRFVPDRPMTIQTVSGIDMLILLPHSEQIQRITLGRPGDYQVRASAAADGISLRQLRALSQTIMEVETSQHRYEFSLTPASDNNVPYLIRIEQPRAAAMVHPMSPRPGDLTPYKVSGSSALRPQSISDDGLRTYIKWGESQLIPAVFAIDSMGQEEMVDGYMRQGIFTIDRVYEKLVFRINRSAVFATRQQKESRLHGS